MTDRKRKKKDVLAGKRDPVSKLYRGVRDYVIANKGSIIVIGGVQVIQWPGDSPNNFTLAVKCMGRKPVFVESTQ